MLSNQNAVRKQKEHSNGLVRTAAQSCGVNELRRYFLVSELFAFWVIDVVSCLFFKINCFQNSFRNTRERSGSVVEW